MTPLLMIAVIVASVGVLSLILVRVLNKRRQRRGQPDMVVPSVLPLLVAALVAGGVTTCFGIWSSRLSIVSTSIVDTVVDQTPEPPPPPDHCYDVVQMMEHIDHGEPPFNNRSECGATHRQ